MLLSCMFLKPEEESLYIGKLAVCRPFRDGVGQSLLEHAEALARKKGLATLRAPRNAGRTGRQPCPFARWGFVRTTEKSHLGSRAPPRSGNAQDAGLITPARQHAVRQPVAVEGADVDDDLLAHVDAAFERCRANSCVAAARPCPRRRASAASG